MVTKGLLPLWSLVDLPVSVSDELGGLLVSWSPGWRRPLFGLRASITPDSNHVLSSLLEEVVAPLVSSLW
jgi:hypothetical protein